MERDGKAEVRREEAGGSPAGCSWSLWLGGGHRRLRAPHMEPDGNKVQGARGWGREGGSQTPESVRPVRQLVVSQHHGGLRQDMSIPDVGGFAFRQEQ